MSKSLSEKQRFLIQTYGAAANFVPWATFIRHRPLSLGRWRDWLDSYAKQAIRNKLIEHKEDIARYGDDMSEAGLDARADGHDCACWLDRGRQPL